MPAPPPFLAAIRQPALLYDADGRIAAANDLAEALAGRPLAGLSAIKALRTFRHRRPDGTPLSAADLPESRALSGEEVVDVPLAVTVADGRTFGILATASPLREGDAIAGALVLWQDVTGRKRAEEALRLSEERLRDVLELSLDAVYRRDFITGRFDYISPVNEALTGFSAEAFGAFSLEEFVDRIHPDDRAMVDAVIEEAMCRQRGMVEYRFRHRDGSYRWLSDHFAFQADPDGRPRYRVGVVRDVTRRREVEEALRESEERLRLAQESAEIGIWDRDVATDQVTISPEFLRRYGLEAEAGTSYGNWERLIHPDDRELVEAGRRAAVAAGEPIDLDFRVTLPSGERLWLQFKGRGVTDRRGALVRVIGVLIDVTPRKRAEAALEGVNRILSAGLSSETEEELGEACLEVAETVTQSRFGFIGEVNANGLQDIAISDPGWEACTVLDPSGHRRPPSTLALRGLFDRVLRDGRSLRTNDPAGHPDSVGTPPGHPPLTAFLGVPLVRDGMPIGMLGVANREGGYTAAEQRLLEAIAPAVVEAFGRKRAEQNLKRYTAQLRTSNEELQRFAYVASHDLQEPLRSIVSFSQLLERRYRGKLDADADDYIAFIVEGGIRMQALIRDLLQVSRIETAAKPLEPTDVCAVVNAALRALEAPIREAGAGVTVGALPAVMADQSQLEQVFVNLIGNAIKYRHPDRPPAIRIEGWRVGPMVQFAVADNGIGIEAEYFGRIFEMFRRLHTHDEYGGTGIGLAVVKKIVERHGGKAWVESVPGEGSTFLFTLPAA